MTNTKEFFVVQYTKPSGAWVDASICQNKMIAECEFRAWASLKPALFFVRLISRTITEEEILLDHVSEK